MICECIRNLLSQEVMKDFNAEKKKSKKTGFFEEFFLFSK